MCCWKKIMLENNMQDYFIVKSVVNCTITIYINKFSSTHLVACYYWVILGRLHWKTWKKEHVQKYVANILLTRVYKGWLICLITIFSKQNGKTSNGG